MNLTMRLTLDGLVRALRTRRHAIADRHSVKLASTRDRADKRREKKVVRK
ncbi:MAG: hypothetical protein AB3N20_09000 [Rhizobiaceae bacterium]